MLLKLETLLLVAICTIGTAVAEELNRASSVEPDVEFRGAWVQSRNIDTEQKCDIALNTASDANLNAIFTYGPWPMVRYMVDKSKRENLGIEFHGWVVNVTATPPYKEWQLVDGKGNYCGYNDMAKPEVRQWQVERMLEPLETVPALVSTHFDYIRYPNWRNKKGKWFIVANRFCYCDYCRKTFEEQYGYDPIVFAQSSAGEGVRSRSAGELSEPPAPILSETDSDFVREHQHEWDQWRKDNITKTVRETYTAVREKFPKKVVSAAVFENSHRQHDILQDAYPWMNEGLLDFCCPMIYHPDDDRWLKSVYEWKAKVERFDACFFGLGTGRAIKSGKDPRLIIGKIHMGRQLGARGFVIFQLQDLIERPEIGAALSQGPFQKKVRAYHPWEE